MPLGIILNLACIRIVGHICNRVTRRMPEWWVEREISGFETEICNYTDSLSILMFLSGNFGS